MDPRRSILFVYDGKMNGVGCDLDTVQELQALAEAGYEVDFVSRGRVRIPGVRNHGLLVSPAKILSSLPSKYYYGANRRVLSWLGARLLDPERHAAVIVWAQTGLSVFRKAEALNIPRILNYGNIYVDRLGIPDVIRSWPAVNDEQMRRECGQASLIVVPSGNCRDSFLESSFPPGKVASVQRGADLSRYTPANIPADPFRVIFCGRICERKGARQAVEAWQAARLAQAELWMVGGIDNELKAWAESIQDPSVRFLGFQKQAQEYLRQGHAQILLSSNEGLAKTLIEGAACGLPLIATQESGFPVAEAGNGIVVPLNNIHAVADALRTLQRDRALLAKFRENGLRYVAENFTWERFRRDFAAVVHRHITEFPRGK